jgi:hypothetical protein
LLSMTFLASDDTQVTIPEHGMIFEDGCHVTLTNVDSITAFFG